MKNKLAAVFLTIFLFGCGGPKEVDISKKQEKNGIVYVENEKKPFTGKIISKYENGQMKMDSQYSYLDIILPFIFFLFRFLIKHNLLITSSKDSSLRILPVNEKFASCP